MPLWLILLGSWPSRSQADKKLRWPGDFLKAVWERKMIGRQLPPFLSARWSRVFRNESLPFSDSLLLPCPFSWSRCHQWWRPWWACARPSGCLYSWRLMQASTLPGADGPVGKTERKGSLSLTDHSSWFHCLLGWGALRPPGCKGFFIFVFHPSGDSWNTGKLNYLESMSLWLRSVAHWTHDLGSLCSKTLALTFFFF